jgi:hypothetical protein
MIHDFINPALSLLLRYTEEQNLQHDGVSVIGACGIDNATNLMVTDVHLAFRNKILYVPQTGKSRG